MKDLSNTTLWDFLESIRERTRQNIMIIRHNKKAIGEIETEILKSNATSPEAISELLNRNKELSEENYQLLELHKSIIALGERYNLYANEEQSGIKIDFNKESLEPEYKTLISEGRFNTDEHFYWLDDEDVAEEIYEMLLNLEKYEECAKVLKYRREQKEHQSSSLYNVFKRLLFKKKT